MKTIMAGIIMNGVTGRMGTNQHLMRSIVEIIKQGGVRLKNGNTIMPEVVLVGRNREKLKKLSELSWNCLTSKKENHRITNFYFDLMIIFKKIFS